MSHPGSAGTPENSGLSAMHRLCQELASRGWDARLVRWRPWGDEDIRLQVRGQDSSSLVEVLGPYSAIPDPDRWLAVRLSSGRRVVWSGPARESHRTDVIRFVEELLVGDEGHGAGCYRRLS